MASTPTSEYPAPPVKRSKVLIIGAGISGPILALLLRQKGYNPVVLEKVHSLSDAGSGLMLMPNGLKVLSLLNLSHSITTAVPNLEAFLDISWTGEEIGGSDLPSSWKEKYGQPACGVKRSVLNLALKSTLKEAGIPLIEGWKLSSIQESSSTVTAISSDGRSETGSFLLGADGLKSVTRQLLLSQHGITEPEPVFTGLIQIAGISPTPEPLLEKKPAMRNYYGPDRHFITYPSYPTSARTTGWAITSRSRTEDIETWQQLSPSQLATFKEKLKGEFSDWCPEIRGLVEGAEKVIKYGLYDREALEPEYWVSKEGRCCLVGDAAHPTSPHLGQGANQALEDCWWLANLLSDYREDEGLTSEKLKAAFRAFAGKRQPRTAELVRGARVQGERRVVGGGEEGRMRDERLREAWRDEEAVKMKWDGLLREPF